MAESTAKFHHGSGRDSSLPQAATTHQLLEACFGARISVHFTTSKATTLEGLLYTACARTGLLVLASGEPPALVYHVLSINSLDSFVITSSPANTSHLLSPAPINTPALLAKANATLARAKESAAKINKHVDKATQDLFTAFDKQFSARWQGKDIVVMERVVVKSPGYRTDDCKVITKDGEGLLGRVKKVLENERKRALQREGTRVVKPAVPNIMPAIPVQQPMRKGG